MHPYVNQSKNYVKYVLRITYRIIILRITYYVSLRIHVSKLARIFTYYVFTYYVFLRIYVLRITYKMKSTVLRKTLFFAQPWPVAAAQPWPVAAAWPRLGRGQWPGSIAIKP